MPSDRNCSCRLGIARGTLADGQSIASLAASAAISGTDLLLSSNDAGATGVKLLMSTLLASAAATALLTHRPTLVVSTNQTFDSTAHLNREITVTSPVTFSSPASWPTSFGNLGEGFVCRIINKSGDIVTLDSAIVTTSAARVQEAVRASARADQANIRSDFLITAPALIKTRPGTARSLSRKTRIIRPTDSPNTHSRVLSASAGVAPMSCRLDCR
jgi:hypothetical protein